MRYECVSISYESVTKWWKQGYSSMYVLYSIQIHAAATDKMSKMMKTRLQQHVCALQHPDTCCCNWQDEQNEENKATAACMCSTASRYMLLQLTRWYKWGKRGYSSMYVLYSIQIHAAATDKMIQMRKTRLQQHVCALQHPDTCCCNWPDDKNEATAACMCSTASRYMLLQLTRWYKWGKRGYSSMYVLYSIQIHAAATDKMIKTRLQQHVCALQHPDTCCCSWQDDKNEKNEATAACMCSTASRYMLLQLTRW